MFLADVQDGVDDAVELAAADIGSQPARGLAEADHGGAVTGLQRRLRHLRRAAHGQLQRIRCRAGRL